MKKWILAGLCFCLVLCLCACTELETTEPEYVLTYAENQPQNYPPLWVVNGLPSW